MIEVMSRSIYSALFLDLPEIEEPIFGYENHKRIDTGKTRSRRPEINEVEIYSFPQTWGSTALGFGGLGGAAMTTAQTVVVVKDNAGCVYFGGGFAYRINNCNAAFWADVNSFNMNEVAGAKTKYEAN